MAYFGMKAGHLPANMRSGMTTNDDTRTGIIQLMAGTDSRGMPILEKLPVKILHVGEYELLQSPLFVRDLAAGDIFTCEDDNPASYNVLRRSGNLAIRVFRKGDIGQVEDNLTPEVEKLGGSLDLKTDRGLVYSLHVNIGFADIERLLDGIMTDYPGAVWYYGNIYDREDGTTPLNWWDAFLNPV
jgi:hypothetical protein